MRFTVEQAGGSMVQPPRALVGTATKKQIPGKPKNLKTGCESTHPVGFPLNSSQGSSLPAGRLVMMGSISKNWL